MTYPHVLSTSGESEDIEKTLVDQILIPNADADRYIFVILRGNHHNLIEYSHDRGEGAEKIMNEMGSVERRHG